MKSTKAPLLATLQAALGSAGKVGSQPDVSLQSGASSKDAPFSAVLKQSRLSSGGTGGEALLARASTSDEAKKNGQEIPPSMLLGRQADDSVQGPMGRAARQRGVKSVPVEPSGKTSGKKQIPKADAAKAKEVSLSVEPRPRRTPGTKISKAKASSQKGTRQQDSSQEVSGGKRGGSAAKMEKRVPLGGSAQRYGRKKTLGKALKSAEQEGLSRPVSTGAGKAQEEGTPRSVRPSSSRDSRNKPRSGSTVKAPDGRQAASKPSADSNSSSHAGPVRKGSAAQKGSADRRGKEGVKPSGKGGSSQRQPSSDRSRPGSAESQSKAGRSRSGSHRSRSSPDGFQVSSQANSDKPRSGGPGNGPGRSEIGGNRKANFADTGTRGTVGGQASATDGGASKSSDELEGRGTVISKKGSSRGNEGGQKARSKNAAARESFSQGSSPQEEYQRRQDRTSGRRSAKRGGGNSDKRGRAGGRQGQSGGSTKASSETPAPKARASGSPFPDGQPANSQSHGRSTSSQFSKSQEPVGKRTAVGTANNGHAQSGTQGGETNQTQGTDWTTSLSEIGKGKPNGAGGRAAQSSASKGGAAARSMPSAWLRSAMNGSFQATTLKGGWKAMKMSLEEGDGTLTVQAKREDGVSVSVGLSDPKVRAQVQAGARQLQSAMEGEYGTDVDLSFSGGEGEGSDGKERPAERGPTGRVVKGANEGENEKTETERASTTLLGQREWIG